jgi:hypothetical protein
LGTEESSKCSSADDRTGKNTVGQDIILAELSQTSKVTFSARCSDEYLVKISRGKLALEWHIIHNEILQVFEPFSVCHYTVR